MSGGHLDYFYSSLEDHVGDFGDKELDELVKDMADLFYEREWYLSGDTCEGDWNEARDKFKNKWFTKLGRQERLEKQIKELRQAFGLEKQNYCKDCKYWTSTESSYYGRCKFEDCCLMHRSETCDKWEGV